MEYRISEDSNSYTYEEFIEYFGEYDGIAKWNERGECRPNPDDGECFSYEEFIEFYGPSKGTVLWQEAGEKRFNKTNETELTYEEFIFLYGAADGAARWYQSGPLQLDSETDEYFTYESFIERYGAGESGSWSNPEEIKSNRKRLKTNQPYTSQCILSVPHKIKTPTRNTEISIKRKRDFLGSDRILKRNYLWRFEMVCPVI